MSDLPETHSSDTLPAALPRLRLVEALAQDVTPQVDVAARKMIADGDALLVKNARNSAHGFVLDQDHYDTRLEWSPTEFNAICSCEQRTAGFVCPHIWATVLLADRSGAFRALEEGRTHPLLIRTAEAPAAERRQSPSAWPAKPGWKIHLSGIAQAAARNAAGATPAFSGLPRQAVYVIDALSSAQDRRAIVVELFARQQKKSRHGDAWTRPLPLRLDVREIDTFVEPLDRAILARILGARPDEPAATDRDASSAMKSCTLRGSSGLALLRSMCETGRVRLRTAAAAEPVPVTCSEDSPCDFFVRIAPHDDGKHYTLTGHIAAGDKVMPVTVAQLLAEPVPGSPGIIAIHNTLMPIRFHGGLEWVDLFAARGPLHVPCADAHEFLRQLAALPSVPKLDLPAELAFEQSTGTPRARLILRKPGHSPFGAKDEELLRADVLFDYETGPIDAQTSAAGSYDPSARKMILRDKPAEARALALLKTAGFYRTTDLDTNETYYEFPSRLLPRTVPALIREGWIVEAQGKLYRAASDFRISVTSGIDWFDLSGSVQFGDQVIPLPRLLSAARKGEHLIRLADGTFGVLPEEWLAKYGVIIRSGQAVKDAAGEEALRFSRAQAGMLDVLLESQPHSAVDATFLKLRDQLRSFTGVEPLAPPAGFVGELRPYQCDGLGWFQFLREFSFGGCLADDMGLGKTIQVLALLESRRASPQVSPSAAQAPSADRIPNSESAPRPSLVVAPRSLIFNWTQESARFSPHLRILDHTGPSRPRNTDRFADYDLIVTTYGTLRSDILFLKDYPFDYAILDEAQAIKNAQTESAKATRLIQCRYRLALSGTPVQNHLGDLWSLFEFLNPGMLGAASIFDSRYQANGKKNGKSAETPVVPPAAPAPAADPAAPETAAVVPESADPAALEEDEPEESPRQMLSRALRPFILRRTKEQVAQELPPCTEQTILCELDETQRTLYDELRNHYRQALLGAGGGKALTNNRMQVLEALLRLRQAACHPGLIDKTRVGEPSAKLDTLLDQLSEILDEGHKALVFSQFTSLLAIVRKRLDDSHTRYAYLDGKTRDRKSPVEQFQNDPDTKLFLVSLKAGGLGLNLTGADYVFLLDPWWNPAVEAQAIDRAHRIGQTRHVFAYRLIAKDTVEEKVLQLQQTKRDLADAIISEDNAVLSTLTSDDLQILLS